MRSVVLLCLLTLALAGCGRPDATQAPAVQRAPVESSALTPSLPASGQPVPTPPASPAASDSALEQRIRDFYDAVATGDSARIRELSTAKTLKVHLAMTQMHISTAHFRVIGWLPAAIEGRRSYFKTYAEVREAEVEYDLLEDTPAERKGRVTYFVTVARETPDSPWRIDEIGTGP